jgi:hypothetical protein
LRQLGEHRAGGDGGRDRRQRVRGVWADHPAARDARFRVPSENEAAASAARCPVNGLLSSAVTTGMPLTARVTSMTQRRCLFAFGPSIFFITEVKPIWRAMVSRFLAWLSAASGYMAVFGRK